MPANFHGQTLLRGIQASRSCERFDSWYTSRRHSPANNFQVSLVVSATIGAGGYESTVIQLDRGAKTASLEACAGFCVEHNAVMLEVKDKTVFGLCAWNGSHPERRM